MIWIEEGDTQEWKLLFANGHIFNIDAQLLIGSYASWRWCCYDLLTPGWHRQLAISLFGNIYVNWKLEKFLKTPISNRPQNPNNYPDTETMALSNAAHLLFWSVVEDEQWWYIWWWSPPSLIFVFTRPRVRSKKTKLFWNLNESEVTSSDWGWTFPTFYCSTLRNSYIAKNSWLHS